VVVFIGVALGVRVIGVGFGVRVNVMKIVGVGFAQMPSAQNWPPGQSPVTEQLTLVGVGVMQAPTVQTSP
jgi:hypothetical protein